MQTMKLKDKAYRILHKIREDRITKGLIDNMRFDHRIRNNKTNESWFLEEIIDAEFRSINAKRATKKQTPHIVLPKIDDTKPKIDIIV